MAITKIQSESLNLSDTYDFTGTVTGAGGVNTPAFEAKGSAEMSGQSSNTWTKLAMNTELFDTNSMYDTSTYRFTPTVAGKYYVYGFFSMYTENSYNMFVSNIAIYKNGSNYKYLANNDGSTSPNANEKGVFLGDIIDFNGSSDYVELYARLRSHSGNVAFQIQGVTGGFGGYKIIT